MAVKYSFELQGDNVLTDMFYSNIWVVKGKAERQFSSVVVGDGELAVPINKLGVLAKIMAYSTNATMTITHATGTVVIPINGILVWEVPSTFSSTITGITVSTTNTQLTDIDVTIVGV